MVEFFNRLSFSSEHLRQHRTQRAACGDAPKHHASALGLRQKCVHQIQMSPLQTEATEFAPAMAEGTGILPGLPAVAGKPVHVGFDGGRLTSDAGILLLSAVEQRLKIAEGWRPNSNGLCGSGQLL
jgi:hypothetical protein